MGRCGYSKRCAWCGRIKLGEAWIQERRVGFEAYTHGICGECLANIYLADIGAGSPGPVVRS